MTTIDDILYPTERLRTLDAQIAYIDRMLALIDAGKPKAEQDEDSTLALDERTTRVLSNGDVLEFDVVQISADCWTAKDANHDARTGIGDTRELAISDLVSMAEDDLEDCDVEDPRA